MFQVVEFLVLVLLLPWILVGVLFSAFINTLGRLFHRPLFTAATSLFALAGLLWDRRITDNSRPFLTTFEVAAQTPVFGLSMPIFLGGIGVVFLLLSAVANWPDDGER